MLEPEDIKKLTEYQVEVFKDLFLTKEDSKQLHQKIDQVQNTLDTVVKDKQTSEMELVVLNHRIKQAEDFLDKASPKLDIEFKH